MRSSSPNSQVAARGRSWDFGFHPSSRVIKMRPFVRYFKQPTLAEMGSSVKEGHGGLAGFDLHNCLIVPWTTCATTYVQRTLLLPLIGTVLV